MARGTDESDNPNRQGRRGDFHAGLLGMQGYKPMASNGRYTVFSHPDWDSSKLEGPWPHEVDYVAGGRRRLDSKDLFLDPNSGRRRDLTMFYSPGAYEEKPKPPTY